MEIEKVIDSLISLRIILQKNKKSLKTLKMKKIIVRRMLK